MANGLTPGQQEIIDYWMDKFERDWIEVSNEVNDIYYKETVRMYNSLIEQYYKYKTKSYIRHGEGKPGTCEGSNLLAGKKIKKHTGKIPYIEIDFNSIGMIGGYQRDDPSQVLENVMNGIRGVPPYWTMEWSGEYGKGRYTSRYLHYEGTPTEMFDNFLDDYDDLMTPVFMRRWKKKGWG